MNKTPVPTGNIAHSLQMVLLLIAATFLIEMNIDSMWSTSTDLAHHYALTARLYEFWNIPYLGDTSLGEMNSYPRISHLLAAVVGRVFSSAILGIQVTTLLAMTLIWSSLIYIVLSLPPKKGFVAAFILSAILWVNYRYLHFELHTNEVIDNFFYAQLVAQAFVIFIVALTLYFDRRYARPIQRYLLLVAAIYFAVGIHLLPALELLCFFIALVAIEQYQQVLSNKFNWRLTGFNTFLILIACTALALHPSFSTMRDLSKNNGGISAHFINGMNSFLAYSTIHVISSILVLRSWLLLGQDKRAHRLIALKYIGLYGLAVSALCLLQVIALKLGHGSEYAVKKHIFALNTTFLIELVMLAVLIIYKYKPNFFIDHSKTFDGVYNYLLAPFLLFIAFFCTTPVKASIDVSNLVTLEHQLLLRHDLFITSTAGKSDYVYDIVNFPPQVAYMMSIGVLKAPRSASPDFTLSGWWITDWNNVGTLVTSEHSSIDQDPGCHRAAPVRSLVMLDGACLAKSRRNRRVLGFTSKDGPSICVSEGLSNAEDFGTWTDHSSVHLRCPVPVINGKVPSKLQIDSIGFLDHLPAQRVIAGIKGEAAIEYRFDANHPSQLIVMTLPKDVGNEVQIDFSLPDAISPEQLGLNNDTRKLGIAIKNIEYN